MILYSGTRVANSLYLVLNVKLGSRVAGTSAKVQRSKPMLVIVMLLIVMTECQYLGHFDVQIPRSTLIVVKQL